MLQLLFHCPIGISSKTNADHFHELSNQRCIRKIMQMSFQEDMFIEWHISFGSNIYSKWHESESQQQLKNVPCSLSIGNFHRIPSWVHWIISSKAFRGVIDEMRLISSCSNLSHIGAVCGNTSREIMVFVSRWQFFAVQNKPLAFSVLKIPNAPPDQICWGLNRRERERESCTPSREGLSLLEKFLPSFRVTHRSSGVPIVTQTRTNHRFICNDS